MLCITFLPNWARVAAAVVGVLGGSAAQRRGHVEHTRPAVPSVVPAHGPGSQGWRSPINPENCCYAADSIFLDKGRDYYFCSYPIADGSAQCELVPDYYGGDHVWLCSFDKPKWEDAE